MRRRTTRIERPPLRRFAEADKLEGAKTGREMSEKNNETIFRVSSLTLSFGIQQNPSIPNRMLLAFTREAGNELPTPSLTHFGRYLVLEMG
jgi:hypothetical protein